MGVSAARAAAAGGSRTSRKDPAVGWWTGPAGHARRCSRARRVAILPARVGLRAWPTFSRPSSLLLPLLYLSRYLRRTSDEPLALPQTEGGSSINILVFKGGSGTSTGKRRRRLWMKGYECHPLCPCNKSLRSPRKERHKIMDLLRDTTEEIDPVFGRIHF